jgi:5'-3' exonuclease
MKKNKMLVCVDASYWMYYTVFGSISEFQKKSPSEAAYWIKPAEEVDQKNLPDLLGCDAYKRILKKFVMKRCETIDWHLRGHFQNEIDAMDKIDIIFVMDDFTCKSFRKELYPQYKAQRKLIPKSYDMYKIRNYIFDVIFKELELEEKYGYKFISVVGAEADDIIAVAMNKCSDDYMIKVLFASDHDFVQLENVKQIDLFGKEVQCKIGNIEVTPQEYLLGKIILGDGADNIGKVFKGVGPKKAINLIRNKDKLKEMLKENVESTRQFMLNKKLISFSEIPEKLSNKIREEFNKIIYSDDVLNDNSGFANLEWL